MPILSLAGPERLLSASYRIAGPRGAPISPRLSPPLADTIPLPTIPGSPILLEDCHVRNVMATIPGDDATVPLVRRYDGDDAVARRRCHKEETLPRIWP